MSSLFPFYTQKFPVGSGWNVCGYLGSLIELEICFCMFEGGRTFSAVKLRSHFVFSLALTFSCSLIQHVVHFLEYDMCHFLVCVVWAGCLMSHVYTNRRDIKCHSLWRVIIFVLRCWHRNGDACPNGFTISLICMSLLQLVKPNSLKMNEYCHIFLFLLWLVGLT